MRRGLLGHCPGCGQGRMFKSYLKVADHCDACGEALHHQRADDAPPYFTMFIVGHIVIGLVLALEKSPQPPPPWVYGGVLIPLTIALSLAILPRVKGALIGLQWALRMHGFNPADGSNETPAGEPR